MSLHSETPTDVLLDLDVDWSTVVRDRHPDGFDVLLTRRRRSQEVVALALGDPRLAERPWRILNPTSDGALPGARVIEDPEGIARVCGFSSAASVTLMRYRPGRRAVYRVVESEGARTVFLKFIKKSAYRRMQDRLQDLGEDAPDFLHLPRAWFPELRAVVSTAVNGSSLNEVLKGVSAAKRRPSQIDLTDSLVGLLEKLRGAADFASSLPSREWEDERRSTLKQLRRATRFLKPAEALTRRVIALELPLDEPRGLVHGDLHDKQIFLTQQGIRLIDLDELSQGPALIDLANLAEHLNLRQASGFPKGVPDPHSLIRRTGRDPNEPSFRIARGLVSARLAGVYAVRPHWSDLAQNLGDRALRLLGSSS